MFAPTVRVVDGADPYKIKSKYNQQTNKKCTVRPVSVCAGFTPAHLFFSGRADNACTNLLGFFVHFVRTRGMVKIAESDKTADFHFILCRTHSPRMARATNSCTPRWLQGGRRESSLLTFAALLVSEKRDKRKVASCFFAGEHCSPPVSATPTHTLRVCVNSPT